MYKKILLIAAFILVIIAYFRQQSGLQTPTKNDKDHPVIAEQTKVVDLKYFSLELPNDWKYIEKQGIDSFIGDFEGNGMTLSFDYGWYSNSLEQEKEPDYKVIREFIDGKEARIVISKSSTGLTAVYFADADSKSEQGESASGPGIKLDTKNKLTLYGLDLSKEQQEIALQIFRSIRFK